MARIPRGTWVEIQRVLLAPKQRAPQVPDDTRQLPYVLKANGFLAADADEGDEVEVATATGRRLGGTLVGRCPGYSHSFGDVVPELLGIGTEDIA